MITNLLAPIQEKRQALQQDKKYIQEILSAGGQKAMSVAKKTIGQVRELLKI